MNSPNDKTGRLARLWQRLRRLTHGGQPETAPVDRLLSVVFLPQEVRCLQGQLHLRLPMEFTVTDNQKTQTVFVGRELGLNLSVMTMPFSQPLQRLTQATFQRAFTATRLPTAFRITAFSHSYLQHTPTLLVDTAYVESGKQLQTIYYLLQSSKTVFCLMFSNVTSDNAFLVDPICASLSLHPMIVG